jgi:hypothetical protein
MINSEKKVRELALKLSNKNAPIVVSAIESLSHQDPFSGAIQLLADLYDTSDTDMIRVSIRNFMNDIKVTSAREEVIKEIKRSHDEGTVTMLVSSCWQSGLDYSPWVEDLALVFCNTGYETALECFTVIEESAHSLTDDKKKGLVSILKDNFKRETPEKSILYRELISILI